LTYISPSLFYVTHTTGMPKLKIISLPHMYQLRPELSSPSMTRYVPRLVRNCINCVPTCLLHSYLLCPESSIARIWAASKDVCIQHVQQFEGSYTVLSYFTLCTIICTHI